MATITKRAAGQWRAQVRRKGFPLQSRTASTRAEAEAWARAVESAMDRGIFVDHVEAERTTLGEALERYRREITPAKKGARREGERIGRLLKHPLARRVLASLRGADLAAYRDEQLGRRLSPITVNNDLIVLSHLFTIARKEWRMESLANPVALIRRPKLPRPRDRRLLPGEEERLLATASPHLRRAIILAVETAMRAGELVSLTAADIDPQARVARLADTKNGESRWVPLSPRALEALGVTEGRVVGLTASGLSHAFHELCLKEGIEGLRFHDLRREAVSRLFERGLNIAEVAAVSGHKTWAVLKRYTQLDARLLAEKLGAPPNSPR